MTHFVMHDGAAYQVYRSVGGTHRVAVGPQFDQPRAAMAYCDSLNAPATRPADVPDLAGGFWGAVESRGEAPRPAGSPVGSRHWPERG